MLELRVEHFILLIFSCSKINGFPQPLDNGNSKTESQPFEQESNHPQPQLPLSLEYALSRLFSIPYWPTQPLGYNAFHPIPYWPLQPFGYNGFQPIPLGVGGFPPEPQEVEYNQWGSTAYDSYQQRALGMGNNQPQIMADDGLQKQALGNQLENAAAAGYRSQQQIIENAEGIANYSPQQQFPGNDSPSQALDTYNSEQQFPSEDSNSQSLEMDEYNSERSEDDFNSPQQKENEEEIPENEEPGEDIDYQRRSLPYNDFREEEDNSQPQTLENEYFQQQPLETDNLQGRKARGVNHYHDASKNGTSALITEKEKKPIDEWLTPRFDYTVTEDNDENDDETTVTLKLRCKNCTMAINVKVNYDNNQTTLATNNKTLDLTP